ncbi:MCE family protein [Mycobacterium sp. AZCC_0083]|uniref:MCE family protein n=1 Tax=Mycobacterium sp. AZCC_0083 TaxID=2735882 RepID=UPI001609A54D|nr:MlaD family protein [Mycobacterium sp. AZCC_0083]MBB5162884.1 phospholipid/cholesterol/gamma-HCH transport system substrate-binding protein [Mycobacterium sp. AZCC_0083]
MHLPRRIRIQLAVFIAIALTAFVVMAIGYMRLPNLLFGIGHYTVTVQLPETGGLYERANVTYYGTEVGQVETVRLTDSGVVDAELSLRSDIKIPSDLKAEVHSQTAVGEQYLALLPRNGTAPPLKDGSVIPLGDARVPPDINSLLDATNRGLQAIPGDNLKTTVDEAYAAVGGLGPEIARLVKGSTALATDARNHLTDLTNVVDNVGPILDTQTDTADSVKAWAAHLANVTSQIRDSDPAVQGILQKGGGAADQARALLDRIQPTLPIILANLVNVGSVAVTYRDNLEQILVLLPQGTAITSGAGVANAGVRGPYNGAYLSFNLNINVPPTCSTGFLPPQQQRSMSMQDYPDRPAGLLYCRVPQDSALNVRGARNYPCETRPGKRAASVELCESDEPYVPLNDGYNWKGDPNATLSGQSVPQFPKGIVPPPGYPASAPVPAPAAVPSPPAAAPPPIAVAEYDPATGSYVGPDGHVYTQTDLIEGANQNKTWQSMLVPPGTP